MFESKLGEIAAFLAALFWTIGALSFEFASKKVGILFLNFVRLIIAFIFLSLFSLITRGMLLPLDASLHNWLWLSISGIIGLAIGDFLLFQAFKVIGARISLLIMSLAPPITALIGLVFLGETMSLKEIFGMFLTIAGVAIVIFGRESGKNSINFSYPLVGILLALGGAVGQAIGLVFSKYGMGDYNAFLATQIRIVAAIVGYVVLFTIFNKWQFIVPAFKKKNPAVSIVVGSFFGSFLGISMSLLAVRHTATGVASTIISITPILIIPPSIFLFKEKITYRDVVGAFVAVIGISIFFLW
jgi:drug/metabolite transporter (DMT)-like permease